MLFKVVIQKPVPGKSHPSDELRARHRRVVLIAARSEAQARTRARMNREAMADTTGDIVAVEPVASGCVVLAL